MQTKVNIIHNKIAILVGSDPKQQKDKTICYDNNIKKKKKES